VFLIKEVREGGGFLIKETLEGGVYRIKVMRMYSEL